MFWAQRRDAVVSRVESTPTRAMSSTLLSNLELPRTYGRIFVARLHRIVVIAEQERPVNYQLSVRLAPIGAFCFNCIQDQFDG